MNWDISTIIVSVTIIFVVFCFGVSAGWHAHIEYMKEKSTVLKDDILKLVNYAKELENKLGVKRKK